MNAWSRVMEQPSSLAARYALLEAWKAEANPQAELLEAQLAYRLIPPSARSSAAAWELKRTMNRLIKAHGAEWAGRIAVLVSRYEFCRGLVAEVDLPGERFFDLLPELLTLAPIQHVDLQSPYGPIEEILASPMLAKLSSLHLDGAQSACGDRGAIALANNPNAIHLAEVSMWNCDITRVGVEALGASTHLRHAKYIGLELNPCNPGPRVIDEGEGNWLAFRPPLAEELEKKYGLRPWLAMPEGYLPTWPPHRDELALIHDHVFEHPLLALEKLALEVDQLASGDEAEQVAAQAKRARLLNELNTAGLLSGQPDVSRRVGGHKTLRSYHDACLQMSSYHRSAARARLVRSEAPQKPTDGNVSLDWFRFPSSYQPAGVAAHDWLALCERNLIDPMPESNGVRFVRLEGQICMLFYRVEGASGPKLWRAKLDQDGGVAPNRELTTRAQQFAKDVLEEMDKPKSLEREKYEAQKEREDQESIERMYVATGQYEPSQMFTKLIEWMIEAIEQRNPPDGPFEPIEFALQYKRRKGALRFAPVPGKPARRYVEISIKTESELSTSSAMFDTGTNAEIVQYLRRPTMAAELIEMADDGIVSLARNELA